MFFFLCYSPSQLAVSCCQSFLLTPKKANSSQKREMSNSLKDILGYFKESSKDFEKRKVRGDDSKDENQWALMIPAVLGGVINASCRLRRCKCSESAITLFIYFFNSKKYIIGFEGKFLKTNGKHHA